MTTGSYDIPVKPGARKTDPTPEQVNRTVAIQSGNPLKATANANKTSDPAGRWRAVIGPPVGQSVWVVSRIVIQCDAPICEGYVFIAPVVQPGQNVQSQYMVSNTTYANLNENDPIHPYVIPQNQALYVVWNTTLGTFAVVNVEYTST